MHIQVLYFDSTSFIAACGVVSNVSPSEEDDGENVSPSIIPTTENTAGLLPTSRTMGLPAPTNARSLNVAVIVEGEEEADNSGTEK